MQRPRKFLPFWVATILASSLVMTPVAVAKRKPTSTRLVWNAQDNHLDRVDDDITALKRRISLLVNSHKKNVNIDSMVSTRNQYHVVGHDDDENLQGHYYQLLWALRAGARYEPDSDYGDDDYGYDDDYDDEEDDRPDYDHAMMDSPNLRDVPKSRNRRPTSNGPPPRRNGQRPPPSSGGKYKRPQGKRKRPKHWTQRVASKSLSIGTSVLMGTVRQSGKLAYNIVKPKHVELREIAGLWRLDQQVTEGPKNAPNSKLLASVATFVLDIKKRVLVLNSNNDSKNEDSKETPTEIKRPFQFKRTKLGSYQTEFVAPAFLVGDKPRWYGYRGTWQRKLADPKVIKLVGKIYIVRKQRFGKEKGKFLFGQAVGTFVARRRVQIEEDDELDEYDDEDDYYMDDDDFDDDDIYDNDDDDDLDGDNDDGDDPYDDDEYDAEF